MSFFDLLNQYHWDDTQKAIYAKTPADVQLALDKEVLDLNDFMALVSPAAEPFLELMAQKSMMATQKRFGKTIQMYIPLYLSNSCTNTCVYCGFNHKVDIERKILTKEEMLRECKQIKALGFEHVLLVTGEDNRNCGVAYINEMVATLKDSFSHVSLEIQPLDADDYKLLSQSGLNTVYIYQETYHRENYRCYHPSGPKSNFRYRLETPDRLGQAGVHKIGLGVLLGLEDWRTDSFFTAMHLNYLEKHYWQTKYSVSFPRLRPHAGGFEPNSVVSQANLLQLICAYRLFNNQVEISLSTRESEAFRNHVLPLGPTSYSAGSKTNPGGYSEQEESLEQFAVNDERSPRQIAEMIRSKGYEVVWKDWDSFMQ
jgi:2-iminoacetate synthase